MLDENVKNVLVDARDTLLRTINFKNGIEPALHGDSWLQFVYDEIVQLLDEHQKGNLNGPVCTGAIAQGQVGERKKVPSLPGISRVFN